ncbi:MAG: glycosyltransferase [Chloroflexi bacterium]|nr:glycosyltransferase [Chloroflexota bacterium]
MKILLLTPQLPYPPQQGTTIRNFHILKHLAQTHTITLLSFGTPTELENAKPLRDLCARIIIAPYPTRTILQRTFTTFFSTLPDMALRLHSQTLRAQLRELLAREQFDSIQIEGIEMAEFWREFVIASGAKQSPSMRAGIASSQSALLAMTFSVFDDHNAEYALQHSAFESDARDPRRWLAALYSWIQWKKLERYEREICMNANHIVMCSETDANSIRALFKSAIGNRQSAIAVVPNGVDPNYYVPSIEVCAKPLAEYSIVFTGKMDYRPNIDAMIWFCRDILPRVRAEIPHAHIVIVGQKPAPQIRALKNLRGVEITGAVPDTRPFIADAAVYVAPLRMGSGTRLKVLEAMAMGKAIVATTRGAEGIDLVPNRDALLADTTAAFARAVIELLRDAKRRAALGIAARSRAEKMYVWEKILPAFDQLYTALTK